MLQNRTLPYNLLNIEGFGTYVGILRLCELLCRRAAISIPEESESGQAEGSLCIGESGSPPFAWILVPCIENSIIEIGSRMKSADKQLFCPSALSAVFCLNYCTNRTCGTKSRKKRCD